MERLSTTDFDVNGYCITERWRVERKFGVNTNRWMIVNTFENIWDAQFCAGSFPKDIVRIVHETYEEEIL